VLLLLLAIGILQLERGQIAADVVGHSISADRLGALASIPPEPVRILRGMSCMGVPRYFPNGIGSRSPRGSLTA